MSKLSSVLPKFNPLLCCYKNGIITGFADNYNAKYTIDINNGELHIIDIIKSEQFRGNLFENMIDCNGLDLFVPGYAKSAYVFNNTDLAAIDVNNCDNRFFNLFMLSDAVVIFPLDGKLGLLIDLITRTVRELIPIGEKYFEKFNRNYDLFSNSNVVLMQDELYMLMYSEPVICKFNVITKHIVFVEIKEKEARDLFREQTGVCVLRHESSLVFLLSKGSVLFYDEKTGRVTKSTFLNRCDDPEKDGFSRFKTTIKWCKKHLIFQYYPSREYIELDKNEIALKNFDDLFDVYMRSDEKYTFLCESDSEFFFMSDCLRLYCVNKETSDTKIISVNDSYMQNEFRALKSNYLFGKSSSSMQVFECESSYMDLRDFLTIVENYDEKN